jgi:hypothetical protein
MRPAGALLLLVAIAVFAGGSVVGFNLLTSSASTSVAAPSCTPKTVAEGDDVTPNLVTVNVYNASRTAGLANRVSILLQRRGFLTGTIANNPTDVKTPNIRIFASDPDDPRVQLVRSQFVGTVTIEEPVPTIAQDGVSVLVGSNYASKGLDKDAEDAKITSDRAFDVCLPVLPVS